MALINMMEEIVRQKLGDVLKTTDCCKCEICYNDILAIALNYLKPKYVNSLEGELRVKLGTTERQNSIDIDIAIIKAIEIVRQHPHH
ncbi:MAG: late competence development ComFB family protein [Oscillospiraceae bacterium]|jgi:competence protein ComFB